MTVKQAEINQIKSKLRQGHSKVSPLVYLVHGRAGNLDVMSSFLNVIPRDFSVISVQGPIPDRIGGYSWWDVNAENQFIKKEQEHAEALLSAFIMDAPEHYDLKPTKVFAFGFSQGAGLLSIIAQTHPDLFDGVALLSGFVMEREGLLEGARPSVFMAHGEADQTIPVTQARSGRDYLRQHGFNVKFVTDERAGHKVGIEGMRALREWLKLNSSENVL